MTLLNLDLPPQHPPARPRKAPAEAVRRFEEMRYGLFIHYGLYSLLNRHEWAMCYERIPPQEYRKLIDQFNPTALDVKQWTRLAKRSGMRYVCLTTRHHEGFALFDSRASSFNSVQSPLGRDIVAEYVKRCHEEGLGVGLYYSVADWGDPGFIHGSRKDPEGWKRFVDTAHAQLRELMTNYGRIDYLFYDGCPPPERWNAAEINAEIRTLQPDILISSRCGIDEDVISAEGHVISDPGTPWESCMTTNRSWGCNRADPYWKDPRDLIVNLMTAVHNNGNFLLNIGIDPDGSVPPAGEQLLSTIGRWVHKHEEAIFGTTPHPLAYADQKLSTGRGNIVYVPLHFYFGPETIVAGLASRVLSAKLLGDEREIAFRQTSDRIFLEGLSETPPDEFLPIVALTLDGTPEGIPSPLMVDTKY